MTINTDGAIIEFQTVGNVVKVTAICSRTYLEVSMVGDPKVSQQQLANLAIRKLNYVKNKNKKK